MKSEFEIRVSTNDMYGFLMYHTYHGFSGIFSIVAGVALILFYIFNRQGSVSNVWIYLAFGVIFLFYQPCALYTKAVSQVKLGVSFKKPLRYRLTEKGIEVIQEKDSGEVSWEQIFKVRETGKRILVYTSEKNAFIWVKAQMGDGGESAKKIMRKYVPAGKLKLKK